MALTRNEIARLRKVTVQLATALDALHRAQGELYVGSLATQRDTVAGLIGSAQRLQDEILPLIPGPMIRNRPEAPSAPQPKDPLDLNLDDLPDEAA
jgi:hypothetical protein